MFERWKKKPDAAPVVSELQPPSEDPSSLGNVLVALGLISHEQLRQILARQAALGEGLLGSLVCEAGLCTTRDVAEAMQIQANMRDGGSVDATLSLQSAATARMTEASEQMSDVIQSARRRARARGEKTGLFLIKPAASQS